MQRARCSRTRQMRGHCKVEGCRRWEAWAEQYLGRIDRDTGVPSTLPWSIMDARWIWPRFSKKQG